MDDQGNEPGDPAPERKGQGGGHDPDEVDYENVELDPDKPKSEYGWAERRAALLKKIEQAGHPRALDQSYSDLGDEFGVAKSTIHKDMNVLAKYVENHLDRDHVQIMDAVFHGAVEDLVKEGKYAWAAEVGKEWFDWLADMGALERAPERRKVEATVHSNPGETEDYAVLEDDEAEALMAAQGADP